MAQSPERKQELAGELSGLVYKGEARTRKSRYQPTAGGKYAEEFNAATLMPMRCFTCGKSIYQEQAEEFVRKSPKYEESVSAGNLALYEEVEAVRICCQRMYLTAPSIKALVDERTRSVQRIKQIHRGSPALLRGTLLQEEEKKAAPVLGAMGEVLPEQKPVEYKQKAFPKVTLVTAEELPSDVEFEYGEELRPKGEGEGEEEIVEEYEGEEED